jgi:cytochrome d ubiquinol oxidase subunit I
LIGALACAAAADGAAEGNLLAARWLMAVSLGFHIVLASLGVALPVLIYAAHRRGLRRGDADALELARRWGKAAAVLFAIGAVSGTVLSFELGLCWPGLMGTFGSVIGLPFALEGVFFFIEAIFLGIYLYGWKGLPARLHLATLIPIAAAGVLGTFCVLAVNGWMNEPAGFDRARYASSGEVAGVEPWRALFNPGVAHQFLHMLPATCVVTGFLVASVYAAGWLRGRRDRLHRLGAGLGFALGALALPLQVLSGDQAARHVARAQPLKFAAIELLPETTRGAPLTLGGVLIDGRRVGALEIPRATSLLQHFDAGSEIAGLDAAPPHLRPPTSVVHLAFQTMVAAGLLLSALALVTVLVRWRRGAWPEGRWWWRALVAAGPLAVLALEAGWVTTEVGRQPWIARDVMLVSAAVTPRAGLEGVLLGLIAVYLGLALAAWLVLRQMSRRWRRGEDPPAPYGPREEGARGGAR